MLRRGTGVALRTLTRHALEHHVAIAVLAEGGQTQLGNQLGNGRLHPRPVPRRAEVEPVVSGPTAFVHRQNSPPETIPGVEQHKLNVRRMQQTGRMKASEAAADDGNLCVNHCANL